MRVLGLILLVPLSLACVVADLVFAGGLVGLVAMLFPASVWNRAFRALGIDAEV